VIVLFEEFGTYRLVAEVVSGGMVGRRGVTFFFGVFGMLFVFFEFKIEKKELVGKSDWNQKERGGLEKNELCSFGMERKGKGCGTRKNRGTYQGSWGW
jgi:hypothetical protein